MLLRPERPEPAPDGAIAALQEIQCVGTIVWRGHRSHKPCRGILLEAPITWGTPTIVQLETKRAASGLGPVGRCRHCGTWWEVRFLNLL